MKIAKHTSSLYSSEVYREFERQAVRKGHFDLTDEEIVKIASDKIKQTNSVNYIPNLTPVNNIIQDISCLTNAMRRKGFITQAEDIEQKFLIYKKAENDLYHLGLDKTEDILEFAHPDGDFQLEGMGELGAIETVESAARKIREVATANPKIANLSSEIRKMGARVPAEAFANAKSNFERTRDNAPILEGITFEGKNIQDPNILKLYSKYAGVDETMLRMYNKVKNILLQGNLLNTDGSINTISWNLGSVGKDPAWVIPAQQAANALGIGTDYFSGVSGVSSFDKLNPVTSRQWPGGKNNNSIYLEDLKALGPQINQRYVGSTTNVSKLVSDISTRWDTLRQTAFGQNLQLWKSAGEKIRQQAENIITQIKTINIDDDGVVRAGVLDVPLGVKALQEAGLKVVAEYNKYKNSTLLALSILVPDNKKSLDTWVRNIKKVTDGSVERIVEGDVIWGAQIKADSYIARLNDVKKKMESVLTKDNVSARNIQAAQNNRDEIQRLINILSKYNNGRWVSLKPQIEQFDLGNPESWRDAIAAINNNYVIAAEQWANSVLE